MASEMSSSVQSRRAGQQGTPESEFSIECFQNYTAPEVFVQGLAGISNQGDVELMIRAQKQMLQRFEKTNEMLSNCNALSASRLKTTGDDFKRHNKLLQDMKKDLDYIFKKIRVIKTKLAANYPEAFKKQLPSSFLEDVEDDDDVQVPAAKVEKFSPEPGPSAKTVSDTEGSAAMTPGLAESSTVEYVKMEHSPETGATPKAIKNPFQLALLSDKSSSAENNSNDSSDCTSDT